MFFLFNQLHSSSSTCCFALFVRPTTSLLLLDLLFYSPYLTDYIPFVQPALSFLLLDQLHSSCSTYSAPLAQPILLLLLDLLYSFARPTLLFLFNMFRSSCSTSLLRYLFATPVIFFFFVFLFQISTSTPFSFCRCGVWRSCPNSNSSNSNSSHQTWKVKIFVFNFCLLMSFFNFPCFWEMVVDNVFDFCA